MKKSSNVEDKNIKKKLIKNENIKSNKMKKINTFKIINLLIFSFFIFALEKIEIIYYKLYFHNLIKLKEGIVESNNYEDFEKMKNKYKQDPFLKQYLDQISIISHVYNKNIKKLKENKNNIHISMAFNNKYLYPILIGIVSVLTNNNNNKTFVTYHLLCNPDVKEITISKIKSLMNEYSSNLEIIFYYMGTNFFKFKKLRITQSCFYRVLLPIITQPDRILYLDGDVLAYKDLSDLYQINFNDNYIMGILDYFSYGIDYLGINSTIYINSGVILLNSEKIRNDKMYYKILNITNSNMRIRHADQTVLNYVLYPKIGRIPYKYTIFNYNIESDTEVYLKALRTKINITELIEAVKDPTLIHYVSCYPKMWNSKAKYTIDKCKERKNCSCEGPQNIWYSFANKTLYYKEIVKYYKLKKLK